MREEAIAGVVAAAINRAVSPLLARLAVLEAEAALVPELRRDVIALRERQASLESRPAVPGPPGAEGRPGADGLGFEDLAVEFDGERTLALVFERNGTRKAFPIALPFQKYQGVYQHGREYALGDTVTVGGSVWHCAAPTITAPGAGNPAWKLCVKGR